MYIQIKNVELWSEDYYKIINLLEKNGYSCKDGNAYNDRTFNLMKSMKMKGN